MRTGKAIRLDDLVRDPKRLRDLVATCLADYLAASSVEQSAEIPRPAPSLATCDAYPGDVYLWGCDASDPSPAPKWALVDGGIAILGTGHVHAERYLDGHGPIISWATLLREGLLRQPSPVARLWSGVSPAPAGAPTCTSAYTGATLRSWQVVARGDAAER